MEINGILAEMIFKKNKYRHDFYVEESYVIRWMYPYMTPHGLIMKINKEPLPGLTPSQVNDDMDFWDWYIRRLTAQETFRRDVVARKSFSKLRSAIAGLYVHCNSHNMDMGERAFYEACILYPLSPESNFRLAQEVFLPQQRFADAVEVLDSFAQADPGTDDRVGGLIGEIKRIEGLNGRIRALEGQQSQQQLPLTNVIELADLYLQAGQQQRAYELAGSILNASNLPAAGYFQSAQIMVQLGRNNEAVQGLDRCIAQLATEPQIPAEILVQIRDMYARAERLDRMVSTMQLYVKLQPGDWRGWLDLAGLQQSANMRDAAIKSFDQAMRLGGQEARAIVQQDQRFAPLREAVAKPARNLLELPGGL